MYMYMYTCKYQFSDAAIHIRLLVINYYFYAAVL